MTNLQQHKVNQSIDECLLHIKRLQFALNNVAAIYPLNTKKYLSLSEDEIEHLDQLVYRFTKLQDAMGLRLFSAVLLWIGEEMQTKPFRDKLNRLEQLAIINSANEWNYLRELRNQLAHEYPNEEDLIVETLNELYNKIPLLIKMFKRVKQYVEDSKKK